MSYYTQLKHDEDILRYCSCHMITGVITRVKGEGKGNTLW